MKLHSVISLVTNSSGEIYVIRKDQIPDGLETIIPILWKHWYTNIADDYDRESFPITYDPTWMFQDMDKANVSDYLSPYHLSGISASILDYILFAHASDISNPTVKRILSQFLLDPKNKDILNILLEFEQAKNNLKSYETKENSTDNSWSDLYTRKIDVAGKVTEETIEEKLEPLLLTLSIYEEAMSYPSASNILKDINIYKSYKTAELTKEIDDHTEPASFLHYICNILGWTCYHNG
jgi:hypothetical protein